MKTDIRHFHILVLLRSARAGAVAGLAATIAALSFGQEPSFPEVPGWRMTENAAVYNTNNLWDIIDGAADLYLKYGFVDLSIARYSSRDSVEVKVELYRHSSTTNAFGIFSQERDTAYNFINIGVQGYLQKGALNFLSGMYYVKLATHNTGKAAQQAMLTLGRKIEEHLKQGKSWPDALKMFPRRGMLANTEQFVAENFLGFRFLNQVFVASYASGAPFKMFIIDGSTAEGAAAICEHYVRAVPNTAVKKVAAAQYEILDPRNRLVEIAVVKHFLAGIIDCGNNQTRKAHLRELVAKLAR